MGRAGDNPIRYWTRQFRGVDVTDQILMTYVTFGAALVGAGVFAGLLAGLLGVGGGIIIVPILYSLFTLMGVDSSVNMHLAIGTSLSTIIVTATTSTRAHLRRGSVDTSLLRNWAPWIIVGVIIGAVLVSYATSRFLTLVFASVSLVVACYMSWGSARELYLASSFPTGLPRYLIGLIVGALSSLMGIGGGTLTVPILRLCRFPIRKAVGTAASIGLIIAIPGTVSAIVAGLGEANLPPFSLGYVNLLGFILLVPLTASLAPLGARMAHAVNERILSYAFSIFLFANAIHMFTNAL